MDDRQLDADVVVVGGGPAGSSAAIACARRGLCVVLCERERPGRDRPGETLHPGVEPLFAQLGVADRLAEVVGARHTGIWIEWGSPRRFEPFGSDASGPWSGFQVWRADLDALLLSRARQVGAEVRQPCPVIGMLAPEGGPGVMTKAGPISARMVIDASGMARWLARSLGVASRVRSPRFVARYGYAHGRRPARDDAPALVGDASGWTWTAMVRPNVYQWTRVSFAGRPSSDWAPEEFRGLAPPHATSRRRCHVASGGKHCGPRLVHGGRCRGDARSELIARRAQGNHVRHDGRPSRRCRAPRQSAAEGDCGCVS